MDARNPSYLLPSHPSLTSIDPLDVCGACNNDYDLTDQEPTHWQIITTLLASADQEFSYIPSSHDHAGDSVAASAWSRRICLLLEDLAYSLHSVGDLDVGFLRTKLAGLFDTSPSDAQRFWSSLHSATLSLPHQFPSHELHYLYPSPLNQHTTQTFSPQQIHALLAHLFLGTIQIPSDNEWGRPGFLSWFQSNPPIKNTVDGYSTTILDHFISGPYPHNQSVIFAWSSSLTTRPEDWQTSPIPTATITPHIKPIASEPTPLPHLSPFSSHTNSPDTIDHLPTFILLSAHSQPGPGPSGTHEERLQAQSPSLSIISLIAPLLPPDAAVVTSPVPVHAAWQGHNRHAELVRLFEVKERPMRGYIVADAMELESGSGDLEREVVEREVGKLFAGFLGAMRAANPTDCGNDAGSHTVGGGAGAGGVRRWSRQPYVEAVPWGCQAFGGDLVVKAQCMMIAAGLAGLETVHLLVTEDRREQIEKITKISRMGLSVREIMERLARECDEVRT